MKTKNLFWIVSGGILAAFGLSFLINKKSNPLQSEPQTDSGVRTYVLKENYLTTIMAGQNVPIFIKGESVTGLPKTEKGQTGITVSKMVNTGYSNSKKEYFIPLSVLN